MLLQTIFSLCGIYYMHFPKLWRNFHWPYYYYYRNRDYYRKSERLLCLAHVSFLVMRVA